MFYLLDVGEKVGVEAQKLKKNVQESIEEKLEELHSKEENGVFLGVVEIKKIGETGEILPEKPYIYFDVEYSALFFQPVQNEIVDGYVTEVAEFGPFVRIGPVDALVHISQITNENLNYNPEQDVIASKDSKIIIKKGEPVRAMVANSSISDERIRVNLTMKQDGLGLIKLIEKGKKAKKKEEKK
jgi:DNA-directed RNA polymerase subunit E'